MPEFDCPCGGRIFWLLSFNDPRSPRNDSLVSLYACASCHLTWWDSPIIPLSQSRIDKLKLWITREILRYA